MSTVRYSVGYTRNMKDYESLRMDIGVEDEPRNGETTAQAFDRVKKFCDERLMAELDELERAVVQMRKTIRDKAKEAHIRDMAEK